VIDPFDETVGNGRLRLKADALLITHSHFDHNNKRAVKARLSELDLVESTGTATVASGMIVTGIPSDHDTQGGQINGPNRIYVFTLGGLRCVHMGDIGQTELRDYQRQMMGTIDILFIPVGGVTTIDAGHAKTVVDELKPSAVFPMHYGPVRFFPFEPVLEFTKFFPHDQVKMVKDSHVRIRPSDFSGKPTVFILTPTQTN
jgi:L-ascorbate metabolism protein UlaG (beta-lactamase superfamily)